MSKEEERNRFGSGHVARRQGNSLEDRFAGSAGPPPWNDYCVPPHLAKPISAQIDTTTTRAHICHFTPCLHGHGEHYLDELARPEAPEHERRVLHSIFTQNAHSDIIPPRISSQTSGTSSLEKKSNEAPNDRSMPRAITRLQLEA